MAWVRTVQLMQLTIGVACAFSPGQSSVDRLSHNLGTSNGKPTPTKRPKHTAS
jgi:hypothetical protein